MRPRLRSVEGGSPAFTLIELLVVIAIIAVLAVFTFGAAKDVKKSRMIKLAQTELAQVQTAIESYAAFIRPTIRGIPSSTSCSSNSKGLA